MTPAAPIHPETRIRHVHLKVADLERALGFYRDVLGHRRAAYPAGKNAFLESSYRAGAKLRGWDVGGLRREVGYRR